MVDIVIVNWNSGLLLKKCIDSINFDRDDIMINQVIIVDNNSADESVTCISPHKKISVINNPQNFGFSRACNQGFRRCTAPYVLLLNPDTQLLDTTITDCLQFMKNNNEIDILGCQLLNDKGKVSSSCARFPTAYRFFLEATGLSKIAPKLFKPATLMTDWDHLTSRYVDQVMGAFMFMHTRIFKKLGYFDERFFVYFEELDYSLRLAEQDGKTFFNSDIKAIHTGNGTTSAVKGYRLFLFLRSKLQYAKKHFSRAGYILVYLSTYTIEFFSRLFFLSITGRITEIKDLVEGYKLLTKKSLSAKPLKSPSQAPRHF